MLDVSITYQRLRDANLSIGFLSQETTEGNGRGECSKVHEDSGRKALTIKRVLEVWHVERIPPFYISYNACKV